MKFDVVIGNPPYQDQAHGDQSNFTAPIYNEFMDLSYKLSDLVTLITPARFLFNAGSTPKDWNQKMLMDEHFKVVKYIQRSDEVFPNTDIKGGIIISLRDNNEVFASIYDRYKPAHIFVPENDLISILQKVYYSNFTSLSNIVYSRTSFKFTKKLHEDFPNAVNKLSKGHAFDVSSNIFERLPEVFEDSISNQEKENYYAIIGRLNAKRVKKYIKKEYIFNSHNIEKYKVFLPQVNGNGTFGETLSSPFVAKPGIGSTETFMSIGAFEDENEALAAKKYLCTKFLRTLLDIKKTTQHNPVITWSFIPLQDFTFNSDIDWSKSVHEIDQQLYKKYDLSPDEINFIETKVQAME